MVRLENTATPWLATTLFVPPRVPPTGFTPMAIVTAPLKLVTVLPIASCAVTCTAGLMTEPAPVFDGWIVNASWVTACEGPGAPGGGAAGGGGGGFAPLDGAGGGGGEGGPLDRGAEVGRGPGVAAERRPAARPPGLARGTRLPVVPGIVGEPGDGD